MTRAIEGSPDLPDPDRSDVQLLPPQHEASDLELTILIPAMNEELTVGDFVARCHEGIREPGVVGEVLLVDCSTRSPSRTSYLPAGRSLRISRGLAPQAADLALSRRDGQGQGHDRNRVAAGVGDPAGEDRYDRPAAACERSRDRFDLAHRHRCGDVEAHDVGVDSIAVTHDLLGKLSLSGRDLDDFSLDTVRMVDADARAAGYTL
jgi:hypothetical protein